VSVRGCPVVYDEDVRRVVASLPAAGKRSLAELLRQLTRDAPLLERLGVGPTGQEVAYASAHELLAAYRVDPDKRLVQVLSLVWLGDGRAGT
jgi:hypothetical protein